MGTVGPAEKDTARPTCAIFEQKLSIPENFQGLNEIDLAVWICSYAPGSTGFLWANKAGLLLWGKSSLEELRKCDVVTGRSDAVAQVHNELYQHTLAGTVPKTGRRTMYPNGQARVLDLDFRPVLLNITDTGEEIRGMIVVAKEVHLRDEGDMEATRALEMIRHSRTMSMLFDTSGNLIYSNQSADVFYQLSPTGAGAASSSQEAMTLRGLLETCEFETEEDLGDKLAAIKALRTGDAQLNMQVKKNLMGHCWTAIQFIATKDPVSGAPAILVNESDTTSLVQTQLELLDAQKAQDNFLAAISHELRTPLNGIIGLSESLSMAQSCSQQMLKSLELIRGSAQRLAGLVNDILDAASARHNTLVVKHEMVIVADVCEAVCDIISPLVKPGVTLENKVGEVAKELPTIQGDPGRINQVLTNLLSNSIKFTDKGFITLSAAVTEDGNSMRIEVKDSGCGIPVDKRECIFGAFQQVDQSTTRKYGGTGLGLALVKDLVGAHNGTVEVHSVHYADSAAKKKSQVPSGTTFVVTLPINQASGNASPHAAPRKQRPPMARSRGRGKHSSPERCRSDGSFGSIVLARTHSSPLASTSAGTTPRPRRASQSSDQADSIWGSAAAAKKRTAAARERKIGDRSLFSPPETPTKRTGPSEAFMLRASARHLEQGAANGMSEAQIEHKAQLDADKRRVEELAKLQAHLAHTMRVGSDPGKGGEGAPAAKHHSELHGIFEILSVDDNNVNHAGPSQLPANLPPQNFPRNPPRNQRQCAPCRRMLCRFSRRKFGLVLVRAAPRICVFSLCLYRFACCLCSICCGSSGSRCVVGDVVVGRVDGDAFVIVVVDVVDDDDDDDDDDDHDDDDDADDDDDDDDDGNHAESNAADDARVRGADAQAVIENSLIPRGYKVTICMSGIEAMHLISTRGYLPDLILLDSSMPAMSGVEMCQKLRESFPSNSLPVIMVSARASEEDIVQGLAVGCNDYLRKPFGVHELNARIDVQLRVRQLWHMEMHRVLCQREAILPIQNPGEWAEARENSSSVKSHLGVTVLICDVVDLLPLVHQMPGDKLTDMLNDVFDPFDAIVREKGAIRILDECYMVVLGADLPLDDADLLNGAAMMSTNKDQEQRDHASTMMEIAERLLQHVEGMTIQVGGQGRPIQVKMGISSGIVHSAMIGVKTTMFTVFGPAVREAVAVVQRGHPQCVLVTDRISSLLARAPDQHDAGPTSQEEEGGRRTWAACHALCTAQDLKDPDKCGVFLAQLGAHEEALRIFNASPPQPLERAQVQAEHMSSVDRRLKAFLHANSCPDAAFSRTASGSMVLAVAEQHAARGAQTCECCASLVKYFHFLRPHMEQAQAQLSPSDRQLSEEIYPDRYIRPKGQIEILSVDDDMINQTVIDNILSPVGYTVTTCMDGPTALELLEEREQGRGPGSLPNLILLDVMMPQMSGYEVCQRIREKHSRISLPIIMVSAKSSSDSIVEGLEAGCNDYVKKPFNRLELLARVSTQLRVTEASSAEVENALSTKLLERMLPKEVIPHLREEEATRGSVENSSEFARVHKEVSFLCATIVDYQALSTAIPTTQAFNIMRQIVSAFDSLVRKHNCYKVMCSGAEYSAVCGETGDVSNHASVILRLALDMIQAARAIEWAGSGEHVRIRCGVSSGEAHSGLVGSIHSRYCFVGSAMEAARSMAMADAHAAMNIMVDEHAQRLLRDDGAAVQLEPVLSSARAEAFLVRDKACEWEAGLAQSRQRAEGRGAAAAQASNGSAGASREELAANAAAVESAHAHADSLMEELQGERDNVDELEQQLQNYEDEIMRLSGTCKSLELENAHLVATCHSLASASREGADEEASPEEGEGWEEAGGWGALRGRRASRRTSGGGEGGGAEGEEFALSMLEHLLEREAMYQKRERITAEKEQVAVELNDKTNKMLAHLIRSKLSGSSSPQSLPTSRLTSTMGSPLQHAFQQRTPESQPALRQPPSAHPHPACDEFLGGQHSPSNLSSGPYCLTKQPPPAAPPTPASSFINPPTPVTSFINAHHHPSISQQSSFSTRPSQNSIRSQLHSRQFAAGNTDGPTDTSLGSRSPRKFDSTRFPSPSTTQLAPGSRRPVRFLSHTSSRGRVQDHTPTAGPGLHGSPAAGI